MGLAMPSLADASRSLPSVKVDVPGADDELVTSASIAVSALDEPVSPELALVDPVLGARLRALLPEIEPQIGLGPPVPKLRALAYSEAEPEDNVRTLRPDLAVEPFAVGHAEVLPPPPVVQSDSALPPRDRVRHTLKGFAAGAAIASFVTAGVMAEIGEGPPALTSDPGTVPPLAAPVTPSVTQPAQAGKAPAKKAKASAQSGRSARQSQGGGAAVSRKDTAKSKKAASAKQARAATTKQAPKPEQAAKPAAKQEAKQKPASGAATSRRFAWAPVDGAVGYRVELFRGDKQVLRANTKAPVFELAPRWRHRGQAEELVSGSYRWYVWPVLASGPAAQAVVQARLAIP